MRFYSLWDVVCAPVTNKSRIKHERLKLNIDHGSSKRELRNPMSLAVSLIIED